MLNLVKDMLRLKKYRKHLVLLPISGLILFNLTYFILKNAQILSSIDQRSPSNAQQFISKYIPKGSKVVSEPMFYYAVVNNDSEFQYLDLYNTLTERERVHREIYDYDYLIVTDNVLNWHPEIISYYFSKANLDSITRLELPTSAFQRQLNSLKIGGYHLLSDVERAGYSCTIYKRVKKKNNPTP